uniref:Uncharacterized protein n=1 Tax=Rhizophora mucronata TaxID=61149 RepID=A0A2P2NID7_RHIMU
MLCPSWKRLEPRLVARRNGGSASPAAAARPPRGSVACLGRARVSSLSFSGFSSLYAK